jgi:hypothetical protein
MGIGLSIGRYYDVSMLAEVYGKECHVVQQECAKPGV